jgi:hypothetical protein
MGISQLQRDAFAMSQSFRSQVEGEVTEYALYLNNQHSDLDQNNRNILASVIRSPSSYGFTQTIVADTTWAITYDGWAGDPNAAATKQAIASGVQAVFDLLTGFALPVPPAPP